MPMGFLPVGEAEQPATPTACPIRSASLPVGGPSWAVGDVVQGRPDAALERGAVQDEPEVEPGPPAVEVLFQLAWTPRRRARRPGPVARFSPNAPGCRPMPAARPCRGRPRGAGDGDQGERGRPGLFNHGMGPWARPGCSRRHAESLRRDLGIRGPAGRPARAALACSSGIRLIGVITGRPQVLPNRVRRARAASAEANGGSARQGWPAGPAAAAATPDGPDLPRRTRSGSPRPRHWAIVSMLQGPSPRQARRAGPGRAASRCQGRGSTAPAGQCHRVRGA